MPHRISQQDQSNLLQLAAAATETSGWKADAVAFSLSDFREDAEIKAIAVFEDFTASREATFSFAMMRPGLGVVRGVVDDVLKLAFHHRALNLDRVWIQTAADNIPALTALVKLGAAFEYRKRGGIRRKVAGADIVKDAIVFSMVNPKFTAPAARAPDVDMEA